MNATAWFEAISHWIWRASWQGAVLVLLVLAVQRLLRRQLTPSWRFALWWLVLLRLLLPVAPESAWSVFNLTYWETPSSLAVGLTSGAPPSAPPVVPIRTETDTTRSTPLFPRAVVERDAASAAIPQLPPPEVEGSKDTLPATQASVPPASHPPRPWRWGWLWLVGVLCFGGRLLLGGWLLSRRLRGQPPVTDPHVLAVFEQCRRELGLARAPRLIATSAVESPALFGLFRCRLLVPPALVSSLSAAEWRHVLRHELAHVRRYDLQVNWLLAVLHALHWFNPLVWLAFRRMRTDRELACDAAALACAREDEAGDYGRTILKLVGRLSRPAAVPGLVGILEDKSQIKQRIVLISRYKRAHRWPVLAALALVGLGLLALTDAQTPRAPEAKEAEAIDLSAFEVEPFPGLGEETTRLPRAAAPTPMVSIESRLYLIDRPASGEPRPQWPFADAELAKAKVIRLPLPQEDEEDGKTAAASAGTTPPTVAKSAPAPAAEAGEFTAVAAPSQFRLIDQALAQRPDCETRFDLPFVTASALSTEFHVGGGAMKVFASGKISLDRRYLTLHVTATPQLDGGGDSAPPRSHHVAVWDGQTILLAGASAPNAAPKPAGRGRAYVLALTLRVVDDAGNRLHDDEHPAYDLDRLPGAQPKPMPVQIADQKGRAPAGGPPMDIERIVLPVFPLEPMARPASLEQVLRDLTEAARTNDPSGKGVILALSMATNLLSGAAFPAAHGEPPVVGGSALGRAVQVRLTGQLRQVPVREALDRIVQSSTLPGRPDFAGLQYSPWPGPSIVFHERVAAARPALVPRFYRVEPKAFAAALRKQLGLASTASGEDAEAAAFDADDVLGELETQDFFERHTGLPFTPQRTFAITAWGDEFHDWNDPARPPRRLSYFPKDGLLMVTAAPAELRRVEQVLDRLKLPRPQVRYSARVFALDAAAPRPAQLPWQMDGLWTSLTRPRPQPQGPAVGLGTRASVTTPLRVVGRLNRGQYTQFEAALLGATPSPATAADENPVLAPTAQLLPRDAYNLQVQPKLDPYNPAVRLQVGLKLSGDTARSAPLASGDLTANEGQTVLLEAAAPSASGAGPTPSDRRYLLCLTPTLAYPDGH